MQFENGSYVFVESFLKTEICFISALLNKYFSKKFNFVGNAIFWTVFILTLTHWYFFNFLEFALRTRKIPQYIRQRFNNSVWASLFHLISSVICIVALLERGNIHLFKNFRIYTTLHYSDDIPKHFEFTFFILTAFYIHNILWSLWSEDVFQLLDNTFIVAFLLSAQFIQAFETALAFALILGINRFLINLCRVVVSWNKLRRITCGIFYHLVKFCFFFYAVIVLYTYLEAVPRYFMVPICSSLLHNNFSTLLICLNISYFAWFVLDVYNSAPFRLMQHLVVHNIESDVSECADSVMECMLFSPRNDTAYMIRRIKSEIDEREIKRLNALKSHDFGKQSLFQTVRCAMILKRKIKKRREEKARVVCGS